MSGLPLQHEVRAVEVSQTSTAIFIEGWQNYKDLFKLMCGRSLSISRVKQPSIGQR